MAERQMLTYFDVVDLVDKILPPKSKLDYTKITVKELKERFDRIIDESGYHFDEEYLQRCRVTIENCQRYNENRSSNFIGGNNAEFFDQNNYSIQNSLSEMRNGLVRALAKPLNYSFHGDVFNSRELGGLERIKPRMTKDKVKEYITEVLSSTWEAQDTLRLETYALAADILIHFGIHEDSLYSSNDYASKLADMITNMELKSRDFYGKRDKEGYYDRSETNRDRHPKVLEETIERVASFVRQILEKVISKTEEREKAIEERMRSRASRKPTLERVEEIPVPLRMLSGTEEPTSTKAEVKEVSVDEMEATRSKYEEVQAIAQENDRLSRELAEIRSQIEELRKQSASLGERAEEIEAKIQDNNDRMIKTLQKK